VNRSLAGIVLVAVAIAACSPTAPAASPTAQSFAPHSTASVMEPIGGSPSPSPAATLAPAPSPTGPTTGLNVDKGPAEADFDIEGDPDVAGPVTIYSIRCAEPSLDNTIIDVHGRTKAGRALRVVMMRTSNIVALYAEYGRLQVTVSAGSGASYTSRMFVGDEVYGFDPLAGGYADYDLIEQSTGNPGKIGRIKSVEGEVDCGNQRPGSATLAASGTPLGNLHGTLRPVSVVCLDGAKGRSVSVIGLAQGDKPYLVTLSLAADRVYVSVAARTGPPTVYQLAGIGLVTLTPSGASVDADLPLAGTTTAGGSVLHLSGDATCGIPFASP
jgi:hypothetical protein